MRNSINATTATSGSAERQIRMGVRGMIGTHRADPAAPRFYCGPVSGRCKRFSRLRLPRPSCWSGAEHCQAVRHCEFIQEPRSCAARPSHVLRSVAAT